MKTLKPETFGAYISGYPDAVKERMQQLRETIRTAVPDAIESISYAIPKYSLGKKSVWFAAYKNHIGLYPMYGMDALENEIAPYRGPKTKDSLHFLHTKPLPLPLIARIVTYKLTGQL
ncbi:DUF1801 domain-containing protein [Pontibacter sp. H259]|uniref:iron chaperone n=1 Tax=Pontibacter sp. H259 TaxID=3133421 RepID=UPI0030C562A8